MRAGLLAILLLCGGVASAQPVSLEVTPDTLVWVWYEPPFVIRNTGSDSLRIDSVDVGPCCDGFNPGYILRLDHAGTNHYGFIWRWPHEQVYQWNGKPFFPDVVLAPGDSADLYVEGMDPCPICRSGEIDTWVPFQFWAADDPDSLTRTLAYTYPVEAEPTIPGDGHHVLAVTGANPFTARTELTVRSAGGHVHVYLVDVLGRRVRTLHAGRLSAEPYRISVAADGLSPGLFLAQVVVDGGRLVATRPLVLVR